MAIPRIPTTAEKLASMGPTMPAPHRVYSEGPVAGSGELKYAEGDPVPLAEARAYGWISQLPDADEPAPRHASARGRKVRIAERETR